MPNNVVHFAVHADDVPRAKRFYESVFGWRFTPWGPPGFFLVATGTDDAPGIRGALQERRAPVEGPGMIGFECTIGVEALDPIIDAITEHGGTIVLPKTEIPTVGTMIQFNDTEGNLVGAMCYDTP